MDVWFYEAFAEEADAIRRHLPAGIEAGFSAETVQEAGHTEPPAPILTCRTQSRFPPAWAGRVECVISRSTGTDHLRRLTGWAPTPALGHLPEYCHQAVAEHALSMILALSRRLRRQMANFRTFDRDGLTGRAVRGRTLAVVGVGRIGREVGRLGAAVGMEVLGVDVNPWAPDVTYVSAEDALSRADIVVCAMDLNASTVGWFDAARVASMRQGAVFVNVSRGEISPPSVLLAALESGRLAGVALDVFDHEDELAVALRAGTPVVHPEARAAVALGTHPDAICTPHNAFNTEEAVERKAAQTVVQVEAWRSRKALVWPVAP